MTAKLAENTNPTEQQAEEVAIKSKKVAPEKIKSASKENK